MEMKRILFLENALCLRGTSQTLYNMAHYNEVILKNRSIILTRPLWLTSQLKREFNQEAYSYFSSRFEMLYYTDVNEIDRIIQENKIDLVFIEKAGSPTDGLNPKSVPSIIHSVFTTLEPHGTLYCPISEALNIHHGTNYPVIPYMVDMMDHNVNMRKELNIPETAHVFGTYSGWECFNINYVKDTVKQIVSKKNDNGDLEFPQIYFIFMNIEPFCESTDHCIFLQGSIDPWIKRQFVNTCNAQLYGRDGGETFGLACGEFSICNKPVICRSSEVGDSHLRILGDRIIGHNNPSELFELLTNFSKYDNTSRLMLETTGGYKDYRPNQVMKIFNQYIQQVSN